MIRSRLLRAPLLVLTAFVALSCADSPTAPPTAPSAVATTTAVATPNSTDNALLGGLLGGLLRTVTSVVGFVGDATGLTVHPVAWNSSYEHVSHTVSGTITPWGGTLSIPESDFTLVFPMGAVSEPTVITITSDANYVAYKMQPSGIRFAKPLVATQKLRYTSVAGHPLSTKLFGAYISDDLLDLGQLLNALEIELSTTIFAPGSSSVPDTEAWIINHFSRYMLASG
jgi:ZU5 domain